MANIVRWEPWNELVSLRDAMDRLFEESVVRPRSRFAPLTGALAVDVYETKDDIVVKTGVPGVKADELDITIVGELLTIKGEFKESEEIDEENYIRRERRFGSFCRSVSLPTAVEADKATAEFEDGVLTLNIPKAEAVKPKTIEVKAKK